MTPPMVMMMKLVSSMALLTVTALMAKELANEGMPAARDTGLRGLRV